MPAIPESTKTSLTQRLRAHAQTNWSQLSRVHVRYRGPFAYIDGQLPDGEILPLMRLRYGGSAVRYGAVRCFVVITESSCCAPRRTNGRTSLGNSSLPSGVHVSRGNHQVR
ncbi:MAG: hypothetical protein ACRDTA_18705 [Pseudonocardiaceae bacterium]